MIVPIAIGDGVLVVAEATELTSGLCAASARA
jgi:hypothetical protein